MPTPVPADPLRERLERAVEGLVYSSESDVPFEFFAIDAPAAAPKDSHTLATLLAGPFGHGDHVEERTLEQFLKRHIETSDPYDARAQAIRPRYEALRTLLRQSLAGVRVLRVKRAADRAVVRCYLVGTDEGGRIVGLATSAIET